MKVSAAIAIMVAVNTAYAECNFVRINNKNPAGQSLLETTSKLGPSGYSRLPREDGWSFSKDAFSEIGVTAEHADFIWLGTYKNLVFQSNLRYATIQLKNLSSSIESRLDACAKKTTSDCWVDSDGNYYQVARDSKDTYLYITYPRFGSPDDPDLPPRGCVPSAR